MSNDYFDSADYTAATRRTTARSVIPNNIAAAVEAGFDKLPGEAALKQGRVTYGTDTGAADAYYITLPYAPAAYTEGLRISFKAANTNTGASSVNVDNGSGSGLGIKAIKRSSGNDLAAGDIVDDSIVELSYNGVSFTLLTSHSDASSAEASATAAAASASSASSSAGSAATSASAASVSAAAAAASAAAANLPSPVAALSMLRVNAAGTGYELRTSTEMKADLGLVIGTNVQAYNVNLGGIAGLTSAADKVPYFTGIDGASALATFTAYGRGLVAVADEAAFKTLVNLEAGTDFLAPNGDASQLTNLPVTNAADVRLLALKVAALGGDRINMVDGIADPFADETDVDTGSASGQTYDGTGDFYHNPGGFTQIAQGTGTAIGTMSANGGLSAAFDSTTSQAATSCAGVANNQSVGGGLYGGYVGKDWGSGVTKTVTKFVVYGSSDVGFVNADAGVSVTIKLQGSTDNFSSSIVDLYSNTHTDPDNATPITIDSGITITTAYRYHRVLVAYTSNTATYHVAELQFFETTVPAVMSLPSDAFTADSAPDSVRLGVQIEPQESIAINTDVIGEVSRDGGTTWTAGTLALVETLADGTEYYEDAEIDISAQPSGTSMKWRVRVLNNKHVEVHGVVFQWGA